MDGRRAHNTELMDRAAGGDADAFGDLALRVQDGLYRFARAQGLGSADAAEAVQEALMRAWRLRRRWRAGADATAWLYGIAMNVVRETQRRRRRAPDAGFEGDLPAATERPGDADGAEAALLAELLIGLPPRQREAVACRYLHGMTVRQTAAAMGCAEGTVKAAVFAALGNLRAALRARQAASLERP